MIIEIKVIEYTGKINHDSINIFDLDEVYTEEAIENFWNEILKSNSKSISEFLMKLLVKSIDEIMDKSLEEQNGI